jgi:predicted alpha/beta hydrolase
MARVAATNASCDAETIEIRTADGHALRADVREPDTANAAGVAILAHAMFARRTEFERPRGRSLVDLFAERGYRTIAFDFRGHGDSGPGAAQGGDWSYDDLVRSDLPAVAACARARWEKLPLVVAGHSFGGQIALASQGTGALDADALVVIGANVWMRSLEPSRARWLMKRAVVKTAHALCQKRGYFPARALGLGSDDASSRVMASIERCMREGRWTSDDGKVDYGALLASIRVPVATVSSRGDPLLCHPHCARAMVARVSGPRLSENLARSDDGSPPPGHTSLVTSDRVRDMYRRVLAWLDSQPGRLAKSNILLI